MSVTASWIAIIPQKKSYQSTHDRVKTIRLKKNMAGSNRTSLDFRLVFNPEINSPYLSLNLLFFHLSFLMARFAIRTMGRIGQSTRNTMQSMFEKFKEPSFMCQKNFFPLINA